MLFGSVTVPPNQKVGPVAETGEGAVARKNKARRNDGQNEKPEG